MNTQKNKMNLMLAQKKVPCFLMLVSLLFMTGFTSLSAAEHVYISDNLRVGVRETPDSTTPPISVVFTGMRLEIHERVEGYLKITSDKGIEGWIKDIYVTEKAPAIIRLNALQLRYKKLEKALAAGSNSSEILEKANLSLNGQLEEMKAAQREWSIERAELMAIQYQESSWLWMVGIALLIGVSFAAGIFWYKNYVMRRLGGLRV